MEEKIKKTNLIEGHKILWILVSVLIIAVIAQGYQINNLEGLIRDADSVFAEQKKVEVQLARDISQVDGDAQRTSKALEEVRENTGILWYSKMQKSSLDKVIKWWKDNSRFSNCDVAPINLNIQTGFMGYAGEWADTLVAEYPDRGYQVTNINGDIKCYRFPIDTMTPPETDCLNLCKNEDEVAK